MNTIGWLFVFLGVLVIRAVSKGRGITDIPGDLGDILTGILTNNPAKIKAALGAKGESAPLTFVKSGVDTGFQLGTSGEASAYKLGAVVPSLVPIANDVGKRFGIKTIIGVRKDNGGYGDKEHASGHAIDIFVDSKERGDAVVNYLIARPAQFNIKYVIWYQRIWYPGTGWRAMEDRGSDNNNHKNHVHLSVN